MLKHIYLYNSEREGEPHKLFSYLVLFNLLLKDRSIFIRRQLALQFGALCIDPHHQVVQAFLKLLGILEGFIHPLLFLEGELACVLPCLVELLQVLLCDSRIIQYIRDQVLTAGVGGVYLLLVFAELLLDFLSQQQQ